MAWCLSKHRDNFILHYCDSGRNMEHLWTGENPSAGRIRSSATLFTTNSYKHCLGTEVGIHGETPASNRRTYVKAYSKYNTD
jgi:hypothetical protein